MYCKHLCRASKRCCKERKCHKVKDWSNRSRRWDVRGTEYSVEGLNFVTSLLTKHQDEPEGLLEVQENINEGFSLPYLNLKQKNDIFII